MKGASLLFAVLIGMVTSGGLAHGQDLLVANSSGNNVLRYDGSSGAYVGVFATGGGLDNPAGIVFGPDRNLYVSSELSHEVLRYDGTTGAFIDVFASGTGLSGPVGLVFGPDDNLYVASFIAAQIFRFDGTTGAFIDIFAVGSGLGGPNGLVFGPDGHLYVASYNTSVILRYDGTTGAFIDTFASGSGLSQPRDLVFGPDGHLYVAERFAHQVLRFDGTSGAFIDVFASGGGLLAPFGVVFGPDDNLYVSGESSDNVVRFDGTTGAFIDVFASGGGLSFPDSVLFFDSMSVPLCPTQQLTASDGQDFDRFGYHAALSGDTLLIGANGVQVADDGAVYVFTRSGTTWSERAKILGPMSGGNGSFGREVAIDGDTALIGAAKDETGTPGGATFVYVRSGTTWTKQAQLLPNPPLPPSSSSFGRAQAIRGDMVVIGNANDDTAALNAGSVHVFERSGTSWSMTDRLTASDASPSALFGVSVALGTGSFSTATILVGAYLDGPGGAAYVFDLGGSGWSETAKLVPATLAPGAELGWTVSLSGDRALVGALGFGASLIGSAYVFENDGTAWSEVAKLTASDAFAGDHFAFDVALEGEDALVGARNGAAYRFTGNGPNWTERAKLLPPGLTPNANFGRTVAFAGDQLMVAAVSEIVSGERKGAVYVFEARKIATIDFDAGGLTVNESRGAAHTAVASALTPPDRAALVAAVQAMFDEAVGVGTLTIEEGTQGCINVVVSNGTSPTFPKYGNAGEELRPAIVYEGEFRANPVFTTETEILSAMAETAAHEIGHKLGIQGHNCDAPPNLMTAGEKVDPATRKLGQRLFGPVDHARIRLNQPLTTAEPKPDADPNDLAILNGSFCVPPTNAPDDGYLTATGTLMSGEAFLEFGFLNSFGEFVYQGDSANPVVTLGNPFDGGVDLAVRSGGVVHSFSNGGGCFTISTPNPNNPAVSLQAEVSFPAVGATLFLDVQNAANTTGGLLLPPAGGCGTASFCTAKTTLVCGPPAIASTGTPSASAPSGFMVSAGPARTCKSGLLLYSDQATAAGIPFQGGSLCLEPMGLRRAGTTNSMGTPGGANCDGEFAIDMNAFAQSVWVVPGCDGMPSGLAANNAAGFLTNAGTMISVQWWGRDSQGSGSFVSDGLQYVIGP